MRDQARILVACDLDPAGDRAIETADQWARTFSGSITVVHAGTRVTRDELAARVRALIGHEPDVRVTDGKPADDILEAAREISADLIVLGGRAAHAAARVLGSVAEHVVAHASSPVLIARGAPSQTHIVAATDFSEPSLPAVSTSHELSRRFNVPITLVHCVQRETHFTALDVLSQPEGADPDVISAARKRLREMCEHSPEDDRSRVVVGEPAEAIMRVAADEHASLIVVASHGRSGLMRLMLGSVADKVLREAPCSVLVVRRGEAGK